MKVYGIQSEVILGGTIHTITTGMWKTRPTKEEIKEFVKLIFPSFYSGEEDKLIGEHYVLEYEVFKNTKTHLKSQDM